MIYKRKSQQTRIELDISDNINHSDIRFPAITSGTRVLFLFSVFSPHSIKHSIATSNPYYYQPRPNNIPLTFYSLEGLGKISGVNFCAALMLPLIFIAPLHTIFIIHQPPTKAKSENKYKEKHKTSSFFSSPNERDLWVHLPSGDREEIRIREGEGRIWLPLVRPCTHEPTRTRHFSTVNPINKKMQKETRTRTHLW